MEKRNESCSGHSPHWKIDIEAPSPGRPFGESTANKRTADGGHAEGGTSNSKISCSSLAAVYFKCHTVLPTGTFSQRNYVSKYGHDARDDSCSSRTRNGSGDNEHFRTYGDTTKEAAEFEDGKVGKESPLKL
jgi:hypothetical protein